MGNIVTVLLFLVLFLLFVCFKGSGPFECVQLRKFVLGHLGSVVR